MEETKPEGEEEEKLKVTEGVQYAYSPAVLPPQAQDAQVMWSHLHTSW